MDEQELARIEDEPAPADKGELERRVRLGKQALDETLRGFSPGQLTEVRGGGWSVKDHLAHLAAWEDMIARTARDRSAPMFDGIDPADYDFDGLNRALSERDAAVPWETIRARFEQAHSATLQLIASLSEEDLAQPWVAGDARPVRQRIAGDSYQHYVEHRRWINAGN